MLCGRTGRPRPEDQPAAPPRCPRMHTPGQAGWRGVGAGAVAGYVGPRPACGKAEPARDSRGGPPAARDGAETAAYATGHHPGVSTAAHKAAAGRRPARVPPGMALRPVQPPVDCTGMMMAAPRCGGHLHYDPAALSGDGRPRPVPGPARGGLAPARLFWFGQRRVGEVLFAESAFGMGAWAGDLNPSTSPCSCRLCGHPWPYVAGCARLSGMGCISQYILKSKTVTK